MTKKLYRLRSEKMIGGVAAGIAHYFDIDPVLVRIAFIILAFQSGAGVIAYIILWIIVPEYKPDPTLGDSTGEEAGRFEEHTAPEIDRALASAQRHRIAGIALIGLGTLFLLNNFIPGFNFDHLWPLILIGIGAGLFWRSGDFSLLHKEA